MLFTYNPKNVIYNNSHFTAHQRSCGKVMFSVVSVHGESHVTITHDALDFTIQEPLTQPPPPPHRNPTIQGPPNHPPLYRETPQTCSNLFNLNLIVHGPPGLPDMFKLVHYKARLVSGWVVSYWNAFLLVHKA